MLMNIAGLIERHLFYRKYISITESVYIYKVVVVVFSHPVVSNSLRPHGLLHARPPCPSPSPRVS